MMVIDDCYDDHGSNDDDESNDDDNNGSDDNDDDDDDNDDGSDGDIRPWIHKVMDTDTKFISTVDLIRGYISTSSVLLLVFVTRNWLIKYPSEPITSTPSYPAFLASTAQLTKSSMVSYTPSVVNSLGVNHPMGALMGEELTIHG